MAECTAEMIRWIHLTISARIRWRIFWLGYIDVSCANIYPPTPLAAGGARQRRNYQQQGPRSHCKQQGQEARKQERRSKKQEAIPAGPVRPSGPCCLAVAQAPFWVRQLGFLVGSESHVRHSRPWPAGPVRLSGPCCLAVAQAPFWVRQLGFLVGSESNVRHSRPWPAGPCCLAVAQAPFWVRQLGFLV